MENYLESDGLKQTVSNVMGTTFTTLNARYSITREKTFIGVNTSDNPDRQEYAYDLEKLSGEKVIGVIGVPNLLKSWGESFFNESYFESAQMMCREIQKHPDDSAVKKGYNLVILFSKKCGKENHIHGIITSPVTGIINGLGKD